MIFDSVLLPFFCLFGCFCLFGFLELRCIEFRWTLQPIEKALKNLKKKRKKRNRINGKTDGIGLIDIHRDWISDEIFPISRNCFPRNILAISSKALDYKKKKKKKKKKTLKNLDSSSWQPKFHHVHYSKHANFDLI